jgi:hypothetical protein
MNVSIYGDDGFFIEDVLDDFCGFFSYAGEFDEFCSSVRNVIGSFFSFFREYFCGFVDMFCFHSVVVNGIDSLF